jgi:hypothetical protein
MRLTTYFAFHYPFPQLAANPSGKRVSFYNYPVGIVSGGSLQLSEMSERLLTMRMTGCYWSTTACR